MLHIKIAGFPGGLAVKESACNAGATGEMGSIPGLGRCPGGGHGNPLQYSCLENPIDRGAWWAIVHRVTKSWTWLKGLSMRVHIYKSSTLWWKSQRGRMNSDNSGFPFSPCLTRTQGKMFETHWLGACWEPMKRLWNISEVYSKSRL